MVKGKEPNATISQRRISLAHCGKPVISKVVEIKGTWEGVSAWALEAGNAKSIDKITAKYSFLAVFFILLPKNGAANPKHG